MPDRRIVRFRLWRAAVDPRDGTVTRNGEVMDCALGEVRTPAGWMTEDSEHNQREIYRIANVFSVGDYVVREEGSDPLWLQALIDHQESDKRGRPHIELKFAGLATQGEGAFPLTGPERPAERPKPWSNPHRATIDGTLGEIESLFSWIAGNRAGEETPMRTLLRALAHCEGCERWHDESPRPELREIPDA